MNPIEVYYQATCAEIARLREDQWRLAYYFISVAIGFIYIFLTPGGNADIVNNRAIRVICVIVQIAAIFLFVYHMLRTHQYLTIHREIRRKMEGILGYQDIKDPRGNYIMPDGWRRTKVDRFFEFNTIIVPLIAFVALLQLFSIWIAWPPC